MKQSLKRKVKPLEEQLKPVEPKSTNNKFNARKVLINGLTFDSKKEADRYVELKHLERVGLITELNTQTRFELIPKQVGERAVHYYADFTYFDEKGNYIVEDTKSTATKKLSTYIIKRKLMLFRHGIKIIEI